MQLTLSDNVLQAAHLTEDELRVELAVTLFQQDRLTLAQAAELANRAYLDFQKLLADRNIPLHYGEEDLKHDLLTAEKRAR